MFLITVIPSGWNLAGEKQSENITAVQQVSDTILDEMKGPPKYRHTVGKYVGTSGQELKERVSAEHVTAASTCYDKKWLPKQ